MKVYTAHLGPNRPPEMLQEGFSWGAFLFGPLWLLFNRAWIAAAIALAVGLFIELVPNDLISTALSFLYMLLFGFFGRDLLRWTLERRGYALAQVVAAPDEDAAFATLLRRRPDLGDSLMPPEAG